MIPRKRASAIPNPIKKEDPSEEVYSALPPKRIKSDVHGSPKTPLGLVNREPFLNTPSSSKRVMLEDDLAETRLRLSDVQLQISRTQAALAKAQYKPNKTKADETRITRLESDLWRLMTQKQEYSASIPTMTSDANRGGAFMYEPPQNVQSQNVASGSNVQLPPAFHNPAFTQHHTATTSQGLIQQHIPTASSSTVKLEAPCGSGIYDFQPVTAGIPGMPQPLSEDERFDEDGNFFGRGRDMFRGPVAKADE